MGSTDRQPLPGTPVTRQIVGVHNNRVGAVYSALHGFWTSRWSVVAGGQGQQPQARRDAYSVLLFDSDILNCVSNDFRSSPDQLLSMVLPHGARGGTNYNLAIRTAQTVMQQNWSTERQVDGVYCLLVSLTFTNIQEPSCYLPLRWRMRYRWSGYADFLSYCNHPRVSTLTSLFADSLTVMKGNHFRSMGCPLAKTILLCVGWLRLRWTSRDRFLVILCCPKQLSSNLHSPKHWTL